MRTSELIDAIAADAATPPARLGRGFAVALGVAVIAAAVVFELTLGVRSDIAAALGTVRFPFKFVLTSAFGVAAAMLALRLATPGASARPGLAMLGLAAALLALGVAADLMVLPASSWKPVMMGRNAMVCLTYVPLISALPLALMLIALRRGAPSSPTLAGAVAGLLAGAVGATFYAAQCPDDSPLFIAVWYTLAVALMTLAGAAVGSRLLKW